MKRWIGWNHNRLWGFHPAVATGDDRNLGQKVADQMKRILATFTALWAVLAFITVWMFYNSYLSGPGHKFDPYPWILLNLCLSCFAALQCFILLIANKRGEQIAAEIAQHTYDNTQKADRLLDENTDLTREIHGQTLCLEEVHRHVTALTDHFKLAAGTFSPGQAPPSQSTN